MAERNDTREQSRLEQTIEAERGKLLQANAVLRCLYEVLLYADGKPDDGTTLRDSASSFYKLEDSCKIRVT